MESLIHKQVKETLKKLEKHLSFLSKTYRECYLKKGRGAIVLYPFHVENITLLSCIDYHNKEESLDFFDNKKSRKELADLINNYDPENQGILIVITETESNATFFVTVNF
jgi:hypothetical protein